MGLFPSLVFKRRFQFSLVAIRKERWVLVGRVFGDRLLGRLFQTSILDGSSKTVSDHIPILLMNEDSWLQHTGIFISVLSSCQKIVASRSLCKGGGILQLWWHGVFHSLQEDLKRSLDKWPSQKQESVKNRNKGGISEGKVGRMEEISLKREGKD